MMAPPGLVSLALLLSWLCLVARPAMASDLTLDHWAYDYLDRLKTKRVLTEFLNGTRPLSRGEMAKAILRIVEADESGDARITSVERFQLEWLRTEFTEELRDLGRDGERQDRHLYRWSDGTRGLTLDALGKVDSRLGHLDGDSRRIFDTRITVMARGRVGAHLTYSAAVTKGEVNTTLDRVTGDDIGLKGYFSSQGAYGYYDWSHAQVSLDFSHVQLEVGRQPIDWGPGARGNLTLSSTPPAYDYFELQAGVGRLKFVHLHGFLISEVIEEYQTADGFVRQKFAPKYMAAHRLELRLLNGLDMGLSEVIIYGERSLDLAYVNPLVLFWSAQHSSHDRDNEILSVDLRAIPLGGLLCYGALFVDELYLKEIFTDDARNKVAVQGGICLVDPLGLEDTDLRIEYARVQPCVYTHKFLVNTYRHDGVALGHWLEQNGDDLFLAAGHRFSRHLRLSTQLARTRHGEKGQLPWCHAQPARYSFLEGTVERVLSLGLSVDIEPVKDLKATLGYLRTDWRNKDRVPGNHEALDEILLGLRLDY